MIFECDGLRWGVAVLTFLIRRRPTCRNLQTDTRTEICGANALERYSSGWHVEVGFHLGSFKEIASSEFFNSLELQSESNALLVCLLLHVADQCEL